MMVLVGVLVCVSLLSFGCDAVKPSKPHYQHFEDYLKNLDNEAQEILSEEETDDDEEETTTTTAPSFQSKKDITCCMLGQMAGDKGYHCFANFYAARILMRNRNRAHNRKMGFYGHDRILGYGKNVMQQFEQCVADRGVIFHRCCRLVALERRSRMKYDTVHRKKYETKHNRPMVDED